MSRHTPHYRTSVPERLAKAFDLAAPWAPLTEDEAGREYARYVGASGGLDRWKARDRLNRRTGTETQVKAYRSIAGGPKAFRYRCGGLHGPVHRIVVAPDGAIAFPDHDTNQVAADVASVLGALKTTSTAPTCDQIRNCIRDRESNKDLEHRFLALWGSSTVMSDLPPWGQAFLWASRARKEVHTARRAGRCEPKEVWDNALQARAAMEIAQHPPDLAGTGCDRIDLWEGYLTDGSSDGTVPLSWPGGYEAYLVTGLTAEHEDHRDVIAQVAPVLGDYCFTEPAAYMAFALCARSGTPRVTLVTIARTGKDHGWRVQV
jgi:hypothetical protein